MPAHDVDTHFAPRTAATSASASNLTLLAMLALLVIAAWLRVRAALTGPMWFDEIYTLWVARLDPAEILRRVAGDIHPPLHYLLVGCWRRIGGESDLWIKSLSILFGLATIVVTYALGRDLFDRRAGWIAALLLTVHRVHVAFSQESRSYGLLMLLLAVASWSAWRWQERGRPRDAVVWVLAATAAVYTHYLAAAVLGLMALWGLLAPGAHGARRRGTWLGLHVVLSILFLPQVPVLLRQVERLRADRWIPEASIHGLVHVVRNLSLGAYYVIPVMLALALTPLVLRGRRRAASLLVVTSLVPVVALWCVSMAGQGVFFDRYMYFGLPAWCLLVSAGLLRLPGGAVRWLAVAGLLAFAARSLALSSPHAESQRLSRAAAFMSTRVRPGERVFHADAHSLVFFRHYHPDPGEHLLLMATPALPYYEGDGVIPARWRVTPDRWRAGTAGPGRWWGVASRYGYDPAQDGADLIATSGADTVFRAPDVIVWSQGSAKAPTR